jgi:DNA-binding HxlR family transcriptional regulator
MNSESIEKCPVTYAMNKIGGKWRMLVIFLIYKDINRFGSMHKTIGSISKNMLTKELRLLEKEGFIERQIHPVIPPKVEYFLSEYGRSVIPVLEGISQWGKENLNAKSK